MNNSNSSVTDGCNTGAKTLGFIKMTSTHETCDSDSDTIVNLIKEYEVSLNKVNIESNESSQPPSEESIPTSHGSQSWVWFVDFPYMNTTLI